MRYFVNFCESVSVHHSYTGAYRDPTLGTEVTGICELAKVGAGIQTQVL